MAGGGQFLSRLADPPPYYSYDWVHMHPGIDFEARGMISVADRMAPVMTPALAREVESNIRERISWVASSPMAPESVQEALRRLDPLLRARVRTDIDRWVIERWSRDDACWMQVMIWQTEDEQYLPLADCNVGIVISILHESDMQRFSTPAEYLRYKREKAKAIREANDKAHSLKLEAAIDGMSSAQIDEFVAVEQALQTGEKIISHGDQEKFLERAHEDTKKQMAIEDEMRKRGEEVPVLHSINPGHHPSIIKFNRKERNR